MAPSWSPISFAMASSGPIQQEGVPKSMLNDFCLARKISLPVYDTACSGPAHLPLFRSTVQVAGPPASPSSLIGLIILIYNIYVSMNIFPFGRVRKVRGVPRSSPSTSTIFLLDLISPRPPFPLLAPPCPLHQSLPFKFFL